MALNPKNGKSSEDDKAAKKAAEDEVILREIDEAVRKDDLEQFGKKYGTALIGGVVAILVGFGGYLYWDSQQEAELEGHSETLTRALDQVEAGNFAAASEAAGELVTTDNAAAKTSALMLQAGAALEQGDTAAAVALYAQVAADENAPPALRDLATIREIATNFEEREPADVIERLSSLAVPGNAFFGSAGELTAMAHLDAGNEAEAGALFAAIAKGEGVPETLQSRARQMAGLLGVDAIEDPEELLEEEGVIDENGAPVGGPAGAAPAPAGAAN